MNIDPAILTAIQNTFLTHINAAFALVTGYALHIFYLFVTLELVVFGLVWALRQEMAFGQLCWRILKIGLIFFIITNYTWIFNLIGKSFTEIASVFTGSKKIIQFVFNPAQIWSYGYDIGLNLLHQSTLSSAMGLILLDMFFGLGILLMFGLLGIQIVIQIVGFYFAAFSALIFLPFGVFSPAGNMLEKAVQNVFKAGVKMMTLMIVVSVAVTVFDSFPEITVSEGGAYNITQILGFFFTTLLFLSLAWYLPKMTAEVVGIWKVGEGYSGETAAPNISISSNINSTVSAQNDFTTNTIKSAAAFDSRDVGSAANVAAPSVSVAVSSLQTPGTSPGAPLWQTAPSFAKMKSEPSDVLNASEQKSISIETLKKIEKTLQVILKKQESSDKLRSVTTSVNDEEPT